MKKRAYSAVTLLLLSATFSAHAAEPGYHVTGTQHIPGAMKWDYLTYDAPGHRLFITNGEQVEVFDTATSKITGTIQNTHGVHGVALAPELNRGFISDGKDNNVTIFELSSLKILGTVPVEKKPDAIVYDPASKRVFAANGESGSLSAIDAAGGKILGTIPLEGKPEFAVVNGTGMLYVNIEDKNQLVAVDTKTLKITARYDLSASCDEPAGLAIDTATERLFAGCHNGKMAVVDGRTGKILATPPIGQHSDATVYDAGAKLAFSSNGDGTLDVIDADTAGKYTVTQVVKTLPTARTMALDPASHRIYLVAAEIDHVDEATKEHPHPRPSFKENSFTLITVSPK